ncbi:hypothetical protein BS47DRAFT_1354278 [Hydnum rufescens UP504]|uniref:Secreted protein n=1 Tax=Hydnum rufescens UP504 TaxID=1448309 RepID=A0A9P6AH02_9AGAM|nr:hypothetical protein BS47DRAFT_1354278 [Hydnum rufescens UP504]
MWEPFSRCHVSSTVLFLWASACPCTTWVTTEWPYRLTNVRYEGEYDIATFVPPDSDNLL